MSSSSVNWKALAGRPKDKKDDLLSRWKGLVERVEAEAMCMPEDKEDLKEDIQGWMRKWDNFSVSCPNGSADCMLMFVDRNRGCAKYRGFTGC